MSGKCYTMREMKSIVEYLVQHKAYGEIRGRKMWIEFANSKLTHRTWQSLKETFLKRILPDIHNPYYKLSMEEICSFKQGCDVTAKNTNKLEIHIISDSSNGEQQKENEDSKSKHNKEVNNSGEDTKLSNIPHHRASTETLVLDPCYETAEDIQKVLGSSDSEKKGTNTKTTENNVQNTATKSFRDFITYSEPLTPMLQEVLDDFVTDEELEPPMEIVEYILPDSNNENIVDLPNPNDNVGDKTALDLQDTENVHISNEINSENSQLDSVKSSPKQRNKSLKLKKTQIESVNNNNNISESIITPLNAENNSQSEVVAVSDSKDNSKILVVDNNASSIRNEKTTQNSSHTTADSILPNNQEALLNGVESIKQAQNQPSETQESLKIVIKSKHRKARASSSETKRSVKKSKRNNIIEDKEQNKDENNDNINADNISVKEVQNKSDNIPENESSKECDNNKKQDNMNVVPSNINLIEKVDKAETIKKYINTTMSNKENDNTSLSPCLKSVSLYAEQHSLATYNDSETALPPSNQDTNVKTNKDSVKKLTTDISEVVILKSHSESDSGNSQPISTLPVTCPKVQSSQKTRALSGLFGLSSGAVTKNRNKRGKFCKSSTSRRYTYNHTSSDSSNWTSDSDSEYVSPPREQHNKQSKKYLKPRSARILPLEKEGGLCVMYGKRIYPLVKDGKILKNYLIYSESDTEDQESYWKLKYVEEKQKSDELKKLLEQAKENYKQPNETKNVQLVPEKKSQSSIPRNEDNQLVKNDVEPENILSEQQKQETKQEIKIKFSKNNEEVQLEGQWPQIHPILAQVVDLFHKNESRVPEVKLNDQADAPQNALEINSGKTTPLFPVDEETREKVSKIEEEIFKEIEEKDKTDDDNIKTSGTSSELEKNVTVRKRRGRSKKSEPVLETSSATTLIPKKRAKKSTGSETNEPKKEEITTNVVGNDTASVTASVSSRRKTKTPDKNVNEIVNNNDNTSTRRSKRLQAEDTKTNIEEDSDVRYKFPSPPSAKRTLTKTNLNMNKKKEQNTSNRYSKKFNIRTSPDDSSINSIESSQGYQDSDPSPLFMGHRKKKKLSFATIVHRRIQYQRNIKRQSHQYFADDCSSDSFNSSLTSIKTVHTSLNSDVYKSESYQILGPQKRKPFKILEKIDELSPMAHSSDVNDINFNKTTNTKTNSNGNSSNTSVLMSPELSIVENLFIEKNMLSSAGNYPTINETQINDFVKEMNYDKYVISEVDVSMPLMEQQCGLAQFQKKSQSDRESKELSDSGIIEPKGNQMSVDSDVTDYNMNNLKTTLSESLLNKINTVNIEDPPSSHSLDQKLRDLLLESTKKMSVQEHQSHIKNMMEVDEAIIEVKKKQKSKRSSSTPRKKKTSEKAKMPVVEPILEEQLMDACSYSCKRSSSAPINIFYEKDNNMTSVKKDIQNSKSKVNKDISTEEISRPIIRSRKKDRNSLETQNSNISIQTDSAIESGVFIQGITDNDSLDLIHNHSDTCLHTNDCIESSVEDVAVTKKSFVSLNSNTNRQPQLNNKKIITKKAASTKSRNSVSPELFCNNAQPGTPSNVHQSPDIDNSETASATVYQTPTGNDSFNSLITEDLSDDFINDYDRTSKWYLLSEDEASNSNFFDARSQQSRVASDGANLNQIFPITCAIPNLSTITETSNENSVKVKLNTETDIKHIH